MPKKKNFLGGMQNYNPNNGEYEPALKGPNGESPSGFKSFKKKEDKDESFDTINEKRMGKSNNTNAKIFDDYKEEYTKAYKENGEKGLKDAVLKSGYTTEQYKYALEQLKNGTNDETADEFKLDEEKYQDVEKTPYGFIYNVNGKSITDLAGQKKKLGYSLSTEDSGFTVAVGGEEVFFKDFDSAYKYAKGEDKNNSFDQINAKRMGKEQPKSEETQEDKDFNAEIKKTADEIKSSGDRYTYMMLDRLRSDAEYVLGEGKGAVGQLWYNGDPKKHIALMKELHNSLKDKPQWLSMEKINEYEKRFNDFGPVYIKDNDRKKLTKAGFSIDDTYSGGDTYEIYDKDTKRNNSISLSDNGKYYYTTINGTVYYYEDLDTAIDRATYKSGKAPSNGAIGWENGAYDNQKAEKKLKELRGY
jgi:hypothetical protein